MWQSICGKEGGREEGPSTVETSPPALISVQSICVQIQNEMKLIILVFNCDQINFVI